MAETSIAEMVRQFPENGMKLLLRNPRNMRDLLALTGSRLAQRIDTDRMQLLPDTFIPPDYRHVESDMVLTAPLRGGAGPGEDLLVYVLIEHQSAPDRMMPLRLLQYVVQIYAHQARQWGKNHRSFAHFRAQPVLPIVFYTGTRQWESVGRLIDLVIGGERFQTFTPALEPLFINLPQLDAATLEQAGGYLGWVLRLVQQRESRPDEFRSLLARVVAHLETMPGPERLRWLELLSYVMAFVYHERGSTEVPLLRATIESSVRTDQLRQELSQMGKTYAEELMEKGERKGKRAAEISARQRTLSRLLEKRFGEIPVRVSAVINATDDVERLDGWLDQVVVAESLEDFKFE